MGKYILIYLLSNESFINEICKLFEKCKEYELIRKKKFLILLHKNSDLDFLSLSQKYIHNILIINNNYCSYFVIIIHS